MISTLYVKQFPGGFEDSDLKRLFEPYGTIKRAQVKKDEQGNSQGWGFVHFYKAEDAAKALAVFT